MNSPLYDLLNHQSYCLSFTFSSFLSVPYSSDLRNFDCCFDQKQSFSGVTSTAKDDPWWKAVDNTFKSM